MTSAVIKQRVEGITDKEARIVQLTVDINHGAFPDSTLRRSRMVLSNPPAS